MRRDSVQAIFDQYPKEQLKGLSYEKLVDSSLLQQLEESGFIKNLLSKIIVNCEAPRGQPESALQREDSGKI